MEKKKPVKTSIVLPYELHWAMKKKAAQREIGDTAAIREAIQQWIDKGEEASEPRPVLPKSKPASRS